MTGKKITAEREARSDVLLDEDMSHKDELPEGQDFWEHNAGVIMGEAQGNDLLLISAVFRIGGRNPGHWRVDDGMLQLTEFVVLPHNQRGKIQSNDFISNRLDPMECFREFQILRESDRVIWKVGNRQYISRPPYWEIKGEHPGVECDLTMGGLGPCVRYLGPWADLASAGRASYDQTCWAEGTITARGRTYTIEKGYAVHDQIMLCKDWASLPGLLGESGYYYYI